MDLMKRLLASPMARKKSSRLSNGGQTSTIKPEEAILLTSTRPFTKYFGIALNIITEQEGADVPRLVSQTCEFIFDKGLDTEGLFRINGNARLVEKLKSSIEESNELVFDDQIDIMTAASFLKLFLRELPDSLIPQSIAGTFLEVQQAHRTDADVCYAELRGLLKQLPKCNYETLKYIISLLVLVSKLEAKNKMNTMALGIVFGPNFFRASMKEQGITNFIVCNFITGYDAIFYEDGEPPSTSPYFSLVRTKRLRPAPPRPPAPKQDNGSPQKRISNGGHHYGDGQLPVPLDLTLCITPRSDEDEEFFEPNTPSSNRLSDSDRSEVASTTFSPRGLPVTKKILDKEISKVISEQLFGDSSPLESSDEQTTDPDGSDIVDNGDLTFHHCVPVPLPRRRRREQQMTLSDNRKKIDETDATEMMGTQNNQARAVSNGNARPELKPKARVQELFKSRASTTPKPTSELPDDDLVVPLKWNLISKGSLREKVLVKDLTSVGQLHSPLSTFKRSAGPKNRRAPSCYSQNVPDSRKPEILPAVERNSERPDRNRDSLEVDRKVKKPKIAFLELHQADSNREANASKHSPPVSKVNSIPNLDLTILHEHGDGNEPITIDKGSSISFQKHSGSHDSGLLLFVNTKFSPPMNQNTDIPPSPPDRQEYTKNQRADEEDDMVRIKQLTKKIQSCKKKLRAFEERFEDQNGFKPSQTVKAADPEIKKCILELARARKDLKKLKEEAEKIDTHSGLPSGDDSQSFNELRLASMGDTLLSLQRRLAKNRKEDGRLENISLLSYDEIQDEKIEVQKTLLEFEGIYGRPSLKSEKELVKPLYDRYRRIKQYLAKASPSDKSKSLQSVPEDSTIDFSPDATTRSSHRQPIRIPIAAFETSTEEDLEDFLVTRLLQTSTPEKHLAHATLSRRQQQDHTDLELAYDKSNADTLHNLSLSQLLSQQEEAQIEKRKLARLLRQFEDDFLQQHGRKVQKEDRGPMQSEYKEYKQVKAQLRLLDCLVNKHRLRQNSP